MGVNGMACPFCRNCGGAARSRTGRGRNSAANQRIQCGTAANANAVAAAQQSAALRRENCLRREGASTRCCQCGNARNANVPECGDRIGRELYGAPVADEAITTTCSDPCTGRREYPIDQRNPFWPTFARPRWLTCEQLYGCRGRRL